MVTIGPDLTRLDPSTGVFSSPMPSQIFPFVQTLSLQVKTINQINPPHPNQTPSAVIPLNVEPAPHVGWVSLTFEKGFIPFPPWLIGPRFHPYRFVFVGRLPRPTRVGNDSHNSQPTWCHGPCHSDTSFRLVAEMVVKWGSSQISCGFFLALWRDGIESDPVCINTLKRWCLNAGVLGLQRAMFRDAAFGVAPSLSFSAMPHGRSSANLFCLVATLLIVQPAYYHKAYCSPETPLCHISTKSPPFQLSRITSG